MGNDSALEIDTRTVVLQYGFEEILEDLTGSWFFEFSQGYQKMLDRLSFKREKIVDIQKALKSADVNQDNKLDFEEWRANLKSYVNLCFINLYQGKRVNRHFFRYLFGPFLTPCGSSLHRRCLMEKWRRATWSLWSVGSNMAARLYFVKMPSLQAIQRRTNFLCGNIFLLARHYYYYLLFMYKLMHSRCRM